MSEPHEIHTAPAIEVRSLSKTFGTGRRALQHVDLVVAPGHKVLATQLFDEEDPHAHDDVVFGAVGSLLRRFEPDGEGGFALDVDLRLEPGETRVPKCPIS